MAAPGRCYELMEEHGHDFINDERLRKKVRRLRLRRDLPPDIELLIAQFTWH